VSGGYFWLMAVLWVCCGGQHLAVRLRATWEPFGALGRVYVAEEGINAQMAVPATVIDFFRQGCK
jgi:predicted sulfurtransferase